MLMEKLGYDVTSQCVPMEGGVDRPSGHHGDDIDILSTYLYGDLYAFAASLV